MKCKINQWVTIRNVGENLRAKVLDFEFETGFGPIVLLGMRDGESFWLTRKELEERLV